MLSLFIRNLFFTVLQPGVVAGLIPFYILRGQLEKTFAQSWQFYQYFGIIVFATGLATMLNCIIDFAVKGRGTLSPVDPTKRLVITGLYKFSRNPMYIGVMLILIGEAIFAQSVSVSIYALIIFLLFHAFILIHEEPHLKRAFGEEYIEYCRKVRRWI